RTTHRARVLGLLGDRAEPLLVDAVHRGAQGDVDVVDAQSTVAGLDGHRGVRVDGVGGQSLLLQSAREIHRQAGRLGRGDQLLGTGGSFGLADSTGEGDREPCRVGRVECQRARAGVQSTGPVSGRIACGHVCSFGSFDGGSSVPSPSSPFHGPAGTGWSPFVRVATRPTKSAARSIVWWKNASTGSRVLANCPVSSMPIMPYSWVHAASPLARAAARTPSPSVAATVASWVRSESIGSGSSGCRTSSPRRAPSASTVARTRGTRVAGGIVSCGAR